MKYLQYAWGVGVNYASNLVSQCADGESCQEQSMSVPVPKQVSKSVIENRAAAKSYYTAKQLFIENELRKRWKDEEELAFDNKDAKNSKWRNSALAAWNDLSKNDKEVWEKCARDHDAEQPYINDHIIEAIHTNPTKSFECIAEDIGNWCSASAIHRWLSNYDLYSVYVERILPLLTARQMEKHSEFAKLVHKHWGLQTAGKNSLD